MSNARIKKSYLRNLVHVEAVKYSITLRFTLLEALIYAVPWIWTTQCSNITKHFKWSSCCSNVQLHIIVFRFTIHTHTGAPFMWIKALFFTRQKMHLQCMVDNEKEVYIMITEAPTTSFNETNEHLLGKFFKAESSTKREEERKHGSKNDERERECGRHDTFKSVYWALLQVLSYWEALNTNTDKGNVECTNRTQLRITENVRTFYGSWLTGNKSVWRFVYQISWSEHEVLFGVGWSFDWNLSWFPNNHHIVQHTHKPVRFVQYHLYCLHFKIFPKSNLFPVIVIQTHDSPHTKLSPLIADFVIIVMDNKSIKVSLESSQNKTNRFEVNGYSKKFEKCAFLFWNILQMNRHAFRSTNLWKG